MEYAAYKLAFIIPLALILAVLLNAKMGSNVFRNLFYAYGYQYLYFRYDICFHLRYLKNGIARTSVKYESD